MPLTDPQQQIVQAPQRFKCVVAGRRFGKTHLAIRELCYHAREPNKTVWYVAPSYRQAKMITWKKLRNTLQDLHWTKKINETELTIELKNGSTISLKGADNYDSLRGAGVHFLCLDEFADIDPDAWYETLRPTLSDTGGRALFIGTPKGMNWAKDLYDLAEEYPDEWASFSFTTIEGGQVPLEEIEAARRTLDERIFRQEYEATWETFGGRIYYAFDRSKNIQPFKGSLPRELHIGIDFNIDPVSAVIGIKLPNMVFHIIDEIRIMGSNTDELVEEIKNRYSSQQIICYPDPAGQARKTSAAGRTDHTILRNAGFRVLSPHSHRAVRDGINAVNAKLANSEGISTLFIDPRCKYLIECLEKHVYKTNTNIPDKDSGFDHMTDALRYAIDWLYPIVQPTIAPPIRTWGHKTQIRQGSKI